MADYRIVTDTTTDLPEWYIKEHDIDIMSLSYIIDGETYSKDLGKELEPKVFYDLEREGKMPTTSQVNPDQARRVFEEIGKQCKNILTISFSSGLSGTYNSVRIAAEELMEEDSSYNICVIDSVAASLGEGLLVHKAICNRDNGMSMEDNAKWVEDNKLNLVHCFTVDDLFHLYRGGRVKKGTAIVGTLVNIKPVLHVDDEGKLINLFNVRGRKKALKSLVEYMSEHVGSYEGKNDIIFISHSDCEDDAKFVAEEIKNKFGIDSFLIDYIGPTIGAHTGPGTVALFFMGDNR